MKSYKFRVFTAGDALSSPNRTLSILKHERTYWGLDSARSSEKTKKFLDAILDIYGGEDVVRAALSTRSGDFYKDTDKYELAEEFLCRIAEKVAGKYELNEKEKSAFAKAKEFLIDLFSYIPKDASDEFIAHQIRLIWDKNYTVDEGDFFADLNDYIRLSVRANPSPEEIAGARRQKEEVKAKWTNPDGSMKKGYMLAPNGKPTKLTEEQWLSVRTPNFKRWFGDWETLAEYEFLNGKSIRDISTKSVPSGGFAAIREWATKIFERQGGVARNSILGDVILDKASVRDSLAHGGANLYKSAAFEVAKDVIEKGYLIFNDVNKGRDSYYFAAPINIDGVPNIVVALVHKYDNDNRFYLHSVGTKESLLGNRVSGLSKDKSSNTSTTYPRDYLQALQNIFNVKPEDVSKVVDENGEPLVVYHGTEDGDFWIFDKSLSKNEDGIFFSDKKA